MYIELLLGHKFGLQTNLGKFVDGVSLLPAALDLVPGTVGCAWVGHRVASVSVGHELDEEGTMLNGVVLGILHYLAHFENIVSVCSDARDFVASGVEIRVHGGSIH